MQPREPGDKWEPFEVDRFTRAHRPGAALAARARHAGRRSVNGAPGLWVGFSIEKDPYWLQADPTRVAADQPRARWFVWVGIALLATRARLGGDRAADQPAAARPVVRRQPHPRRRVRLAARREHADQRDPRGQHGLQPHGARAGQGRRRPRGDAGRHQPRPAHAAGAPAARSRDERARTKRPSATWRSTSTSSTRSSTSSWTTRAPARCKLGAGAPVAAWSTARWRRFRDPSQIRISLARGDRHQGDGRRDRARPRVPEPVRERAPLRPLAPTPASRACTVSYARTGPWVIVSVRDHGPGVAPEKLQAADDAVLPRRRGAHRGHRRRPGPGDRREGGAAHGRHLRARQRARRRPGRAHPAEESALTAGGKPPRRHRRPADCRRCAAGSRSATSIESITWRSPRRRARVACTLQCPVVARDFTHQGDTE